MTNGVRQGALLSAKAYCFYMEELFALLKQNRAGCWVMDQYHGIFGYSDDNWILAPSLSALQDILKTCEEYAAQHNLKFSTDKNPQKCKTKCMAFLFKPRKLPDMHLCGNPLPWVDSLVHLGTTVTNHLDGGQQDIKLKIARYIDRNCSLCQEFKFVHPKTLIKINDIYNCHFSGYQLWNLFSHGAVKFESTFNKSIKIMAGVPIQTHRYLIEPLRGKEHMKMELIRNYLGFVKRLRNSSKPILRVLYSICSKDARTVTGSNLRNILLLTNETQVDKLRSNMVDNIKYRQIDQNQTWRIPLVLELLDLQHGDKDLIGEWSVEEMKEMLNVACTQ